MNGPSILCVHPPFDVVNTFSRVPKSLGDIKHWKGNDLLEYVHTYFLACTTLFLCSLRATRMAVVLRPAGSCGSSSSAILNSSWATSCWLTYIAFGFKYRRIPAENRKGSVDHLLSELWWTVAVSVTCFLTLHVVATEYVHISVYHNWISTNYHALALWNHVIHFTRIVILVWVYILKILVFGAWMNMSFLVFTQVLWKQRWMCTCLYTSHRVLHSGVHFGATAAFLLKAWMDNSSCCFTVSVTWPSRYSKLLDFFACVIVFFIHVAGVLICCDAMPTTGGSWHCYEAKSSDCFACWPVVWKQTVGIIAMITIIHVCMWCAGTWLCVRYIQECTCVYHVLLVYVFPSKHMQANTTTFIQRCLAIGWNFINFCTWGGGWTSECLFTEIGPSQFVLASRKQRSNVL